MPLVKKKKVEKETKNLKTCAWCKKPLKNGERKIAIPGVGFAHSDVSKCDVRRLDGKIEIGTPDQEDLDFEQHMEMLKGIGERILDVVGKLAVMNHTLLQLVELKKIEMQEEYGHLDAKLEEKISKSEKEKENI